MNARPMSLGLVAVMVMAVVASAVERRAPRPTFDDAAIRSLLSDDDLQNFDAIPLRPIESGGTQVADAAPGEASSWKRLISAASLDSEIKRLRLHYDGLVRSPGPFKSGGYEDARVDLTALASWMAVLTEHPERSRLSDDAAAARDSLARAATSLAGDTASYKVARARSDDLRDIVTGVGLTAPDSDAPNDWAAIASRSAMMQYVERVIGRLETTAVDVDALDRSRDEVRVDAELLAAAGEIIIQDGMDEADDPDYAVHSRAMTTAATRITDALAGGDVSAAFEAVHRLRQSCDACHADYR